MTTRNVYLLSGWKTSGKDTFFRDFQRGDLWKWKIFRRSDLPVLKTIPVTRMAFADLLKQEVKTRIGISDLVDLDRIKEDPIFDFIKDIWMNKADLIFSTEGGPSISGILADVPLLGQFILSLLKDSLSEYYSQHEMTLDFLRSVTVRDILKSHASMRRSKDSNYYAQHVLNDILSKPDEDFMITDLRFSNELSAAYGYLYERDIFTVRIFRKAVSVPPSHDLSEHDLDSLEPDYLAVPIKNWEEEYKAISKRFGFYRRYITRDDDEDNNNDSSILWTSQPGPTTSSSDDDIVNTTEYIPNIYQEVVDITKEAPDTVDEVVDTVIPTVIPSTVEEVVDTVTPSTVTPSTVLPSVITPVLPVKSKEPTAIVIPSVIKPVLLVKSKKPTIDILTNTAPTATVIPSVIKPIVLPVKLKEPVDIIDIITPGIIPGITPGIITRRRPNLNILDSIKTVNIMNDIDK